jgi:hypothetical protein
LKDQNTINKKIQAAKQELAAILLTWCKNPT